MQRFFKKGEGCLGREKGNLSELKAGQQKLEEQKQQRKAKLDAASLLLHDLSNQIPDMDAKKKNFLKELHH